MPTDNKGFKEKALDREAFERWLDGETVDEQTKARWQHDESLKDLYDTGLYLKHQADCLEQKGVPEWNREATFQFQQKSKNWFAWLHVSPALSMYMSLAAILMVLFKVELQFNDNGVLLTFAADHKAQMRQEMDDKLVQYSRDQQLIMANYVNDIQAQQKQDVAQLASYLVQSTRDERREEMGELVSYLNDQRNDDLSLQKQRISNILYQFKQSNIDAGLRRTSYQSESDQLNNQEEK